MGSSRLPVAGYRCGSTCSVVVPFVRIFRLRDGLVHDLADLSSRSVVPRAEGAVCIARDNTPVVSSLHKGIECLTLRYVREMWPARYVDEPAFGEHDDLAEL